MTKPTPYRPSTEFWRAGVPSRTGIHYFVLAHNIQREGNACENQQQINQRIGGQMEGVIEDPGQQQNHSDDYEHWSFQSLLSSASENARNAVNSDRVRGYSRRRQTVGEILRRAATIH